MPVQVGVINWCTIAHGVSTKWRQRIHGGLPIRGVWDLAELRGGVGCPVIVLLWLAYQHWGAIVVDMDGSAAIMRPCNPPPCQSDDGAWGLGRTGLALHPSDRDLHDAVLRWLWVSSAPSSCDKSSSSSRSGASARRLAALDRASVWPLEWLWRSLTYWHRIPMGCARSPRVGGDCYILPERDQRLDPRRRGPARTTPGGHHKEERKTADRLTVVRVTPNRAPRPVETTASAAPTPMSAPSTTRRKASSDHRLRELAEPRPERMRSDFLGALGTRNASSP